MKGGRPMDIQISKRVNQRKIPIGMEEMEKRKYDV